VKKILALWFVDPHAARAFLIRTLRVAEDLHADLLHDLLCQGCRESCCVKRLVGVEDERLGEQAIALNRRHCIERSDRAGQKVARNAPERFEGGGFDRARRSLSEKKAAQHVEGASRERARHANLISKLCQLVFAAQLVLGSGDDRKTGTGRRKARLTCRRWHRAGRAWVGAIVDI
jgi:hypothetical protein